MKHYEAANMGDSMLKLKIANYSKFWNVYIQMINIIIY